MEQKTHNSPGSFTLPKSQRLHGKKAVEGLFRDGRSGFVYPFRYIFTVVEDAERLPECESGDFRVLFSVPKRYHKRANKRNLLKRRSRESFRQAKQLLPKPSPGGELHIALIYSSKEVEDYRKIDNAIRKIISQLGAAV